LRKLLLAAIAALVVAGTAGAITHGTPDGNGHPYVGNIVFYSAPGVPSHRCSGTLISPTVVLTAGHCTDGMALAQVWFTPTMPAGQYPFAGGTLGTPHTHPDFNNLADVPNTGDMGVVVLATPVQMTTYGALPTLNFLDRFETKRGLQDTSITIVGYGLQAVVPKPMGVTQRFVGVQQIENLRSNLIAGYGLQTSNAPGNGTGGSGTCSGDSGGPMLYSDTNVVVSVNSFGLNANCVGNDFSFRADTATARAFLDDFVQVP